MLNHLGTTTLHIGNMRPSCSSSLPQEGMDSWKQTSFLHSVQDKINLVHFRFTWLHHTFSIYINLVKPLGKNGTWQKCPPNLTGKDPGFLTLARSVSKQRNHLKWNRTRHESPHHGLRGPHIVWIHIAAGERLWAAVCQVLSGRDRSKTTSATSASCKSDILSNDVECIVSNFVCIVMLAL